MENEKKKSGLKERDKQIIIIVLLAALLFLAFKLSTGTFAEKNEQLDKQINKLTEKRDELVEAKSRSEEIQKETKVKLAEYEAILGKYPEKVTIEKIIEYMCQLYSSHQFGVSGVSFSDDGIFYTFVDSEGKENPELGAIYCLTITCDYIGDYKELKKLVSELNQKCPAKVSIDTISLSKGSITGGVAGGVTLKVYTGCDVTKYKEPDFGVDSGKDSIFFDPSID